MRCYRLFVPPPRMYKLCIFPAVLLSLYLYRKWRQRSLSEIAGPKSTSLLLGWSGFSFRFCVANDPQATWGICYPRTPPRQNSCGKRPTVVWPV